MAQSTILHVEDDEALRGFVTRALEDAGFTVEGAANGLDALKMLRHAPEKYDLMILDLVLPWLNGLELLATLRGDPATRDLPVLVTTGTIVTPNQFAGDPHVSLLRKPFDERQLLVGTELLLYGAGGKRSTG